MIQVAARCESVICRCLTLLLRSVTLFAETCNTSFCMRSLPRQATKMFNVVGNKLGAKPSGCAGALRRRLIPAPIFIDV